MEAVFVLIGINWKSVSLHEPPFQPKSPHVRLIRLKVFLISRSAIRNEAFLEQFTFERVKGRSLFQVTGVYLSENMIREFTWINKELGSIFFDSSRVCLELEIEPNHLRKDFIFILTERWRRYLSAVKETWTESVALFSFKFSSKN